MFLSQREATILSELLQRQQALSLDEMMQLLKVSKRTVYREVANLEASLEEVGAQLDRVARGRFVLVADEETRQKLMEDLGLQTDFQALSTQERQHAILLKLLVNQEPLSLSFFLEEFLISNTTFFADIKQLEKRMSHLPLGIIRNRGYQLVGPESQKRLLLANTLGLEINDYQFFHLEQIEQQADYFLQFVDRVHLDIAQQAVLEILEPNLSNLSDRKLKFLVLMLAIGMDRLSQGLTLGEDEYSHSMDKKFLTLAKKIFLQLANQTKQLYSISEILFFAQLIDTFSSSYEADFFEEDFDLKLAFQVKQLIEKISHEVEVDFFEDSQLYKMLLTHLSATLSRGILREPELNNPILEKVVNQYQEVSLAIRQAVREVFPTVAFSEEEIAYLVLHFANSLEKSPKIMAVDIAGISPSGLASTRMLERRLRKNFPFIHTVTFFRVADLKKVDLLKDYDLVLSTTVLPGYPGKYLLVSPLLLEEELEQIRQALHALNYQEKRLQVGTKTNEPTPESYQHLLAFLAQVERFLAHFFIREINNPNDLAQTLQVCLQQLDTKIVTDVFKVKEKLWQRLHQAPIGIPNTQVGLFHAADSSVKEPLFVIFDLVTPLTIMGMDKQEMPLKRLLLMLAPSPMEESTSKMLGKVSGAMIMNDLNLEIFNSGNQEIIYQLLASLSIEEIQGGTRDV
ncbi:MAG: BglG family transcription antiterminator [Enterococcus lemanii]|jgi:mannitol operon transcriptional antiterminator